MPSSDATTTVISKRYVDVRKLQRYLDRLWPGKYSVTVRNDNYLVKGPRNLTQREQEEIHDLMRGRRSEKTKAEKETPQEQQAAGKPDHEGATVTDTGGLELSPAAESPASGQEFGERGPPKLQRTGTVQSVKDLFGRIKRTLTGTGVVN